MRSQIDDAAKATVVGHMDRMIQHMESMGPGIGPGMGGPPPSDKKPQ